MIYLYALALLIAPGALLAFSRLCGSLGPDLRLAVAFALSPFVMAAELVIASVFGLSFAMFLRLIVPLNLIGLYPITRSLRALFRARTGWLDLMVPLALMAPVLVMLWSAPHLREYGWHNMMQLAALQEIWHLPKIPEEMDLAGVRLNYGWLGHTQVAVLSAVLNRPAILLFPGLNMLQFFCLFRFLVAAAEQDDELPTVGEQWHTRLATGVVLLSTVVLPFLAATIAFHRTTPGEWRITPVTSKYMFLDAMICGLTCFALLVFGISRAFHRHDASVLLLIPLAALACGICYPLLFPACLVAIASCCVLLLAGTLFPGPVLPRFPTQAVTCFTVGALLSTAVVAAYIKFLGADSVGLLVRRAQAFEVLRHVGAIVLAFGTAALLLIGMLWRRQQLFISPLNLRSPGLPNLGISILLVLCFGILSMPLGVEYKFLYGSLLFFTPYIVRCWRLVTFQTARSLMVMAAACVLLNGIAAWILYNQTIPPDLADTVPLNETTALVSPLKSWRGSWTQAVREETPEDTVLLNSDSPQPISVFADRAMYLVADVSIGRWGRFGYNIPGSMILEEVKSYSPAEVAARLQVLRVSFALQASLPELNAVMNALARLQRPVAIHFDTETALKKLLGATAIGQPIYVSDPDTVWLIRPEQFPRAEQSDIAVPSEPPL